MERRIVNCRMCLYVTISGMPEMTILHSIDILDSVAPTKRPKVIRFVETHVTEVRYRDREIWGSRRRVEVLSPRN